MKLPIIIVDRDGNVLVYESVRAAERNIESIDVEAGEYTIFDSKGRLLNCQVGDGAPESSRSKLPFGLEVVEPRPIRLRQLESDPTHAAELRVRLKEAQRAALDAKDLNLARKLGRLIDSVDAP